MKSADARAMTLDQIDDEVLKLKKEQFNLRFQRATGQLEAEDHRRAEADRRDPGREDRDQARRESRDQVAPPEGVASVAGA